MDKLIISGKSNLTGSIKVHGAKNAVLPILVSSLLTKDSLKLINLPDVDDIQNMITLLSSYGVKINKNKKSVLLNSKNIKNIPADYEIVRKMRASILILGPLLSRFGFAKISLPGGCAIGTRPIDIHLKGLQKLGAVFEIENGFCNKYTLPRITAHFYLFKPSVYGGCLNEASQMHRPDDVSNT